MSKATSGGPNGEQVKAWWFLDQLVVEHPSSPEAKTVVLEMTLPVGSSAPLHIHDDLDDAWYILEGEMVVRCGDEVRTAGAGEWLTMPRGIPHTFRVVGDREARILLVHDNATFRDFVREIGVPAESLIMPPQPIFPAIEELGRVGANHNVRPIGPPMSAADSDAALARA